MASCGRHARAPDRQPPPRPAHAWDHLRASDPTLARLHTGLRAALGAALSAWLLSSLGRRVGAPPTVWLLGVQLAMAGAVMVPAGPIAVQRRAAAIVIAVSAASAAVAGFADALPRAGGALARLAVVFAAVWARRFGQVGQGAGMAAFLTFFVAQYFRLHAAQVPRASAALLAGGAVMAAVRFALVRDRPERAGARVAGSIGCARRWRISPPRTSAAAGSRADPIDEGARAI